MVLKIAHRGASGYEPENTLRSFKKALALKVDMIELDIHLTKDKKLVVIHNETLDRTTNGKGKVANFTLKEIKKITINKKEKIPTLEEVFNLVNKKAKINIELKGKNTAEPVSKLINKFVKNKNWSYNHFLISSFNYQELKKFSQINPKTKIGFIFAKSPDLNLKLAKKIKVYSIHPLFKLVNQKFINQAHQTHLKIFAWVANNKKEIKKLKQLGVDGIFSNYPDRI